MKKRNMKVLGTVNDSDNGRNDACWMWRQWKYKHRVHPEEQQHPPAEQQMHQAMPQQHLPAQQMLPAKIPQVQMMW